MKCNLLKKLLNNVFICWIDNLLQGQLLDNNNFFLLNNCKNYKFIVT